jgi:hypothetical protein
MLRRRSVSQLVSHHQGVVMSNVLFRVAFPAFLLGLAAPAYADTREIKDDKGGVWKVEVDIEKKDKNCTAKVEVTHAYAKPVARAEVRMRFNGKDEERTVSGMVEKGRGTKWTFQGDPHHCELREISIKM